MSTLKSAALAASIALGLAGYATAADLRLNAPTATDQVPARLAAAKDDRAAAALDRTPVQVSWALDPAEALTDRPAPFVQESREYWLNASEAELQRGVALPTTAEAALIRISPHGNNSSRLGIDDLVISGNGRQLSGREATQSVADEAALRAAGMDVSEGTVIARLAPGAGKGNLRLSAPAARGDYLIHVFEPTSSTVLRLGAARDTVVAGQSVRITANLQGAKASTAKGMLTAPDGHSQAFELSLQTDGSWQADVVPDATHASGPALWEVHAFASGGDARAPVLRDAKTALAVSRASARLSGEVSTVLDGVRSKGLSVNVGVETASASRYQLAGVLYGTAADGARRPAAYAQSAAWLATGTGTLTLIFDAQALAGSKLTAPYELRDLRLSNQADMSVIERRERALEIR
jgi:hypothetical protein